MTDPRHKTDKKQRPEGLDEHRFYGRRKGPKLTVRQAGLMESLLPELHVAPDDARLSAPVQLFERPPKALWLEVGFGKGEHLLAQALANPDTGFIGCEPYLNGVAALMAQIDDSGADNIRVYTDDARHIMRTLPEGCLDRLFLLHPDPWPKARHAKRRFIGPENLDMIARVLKPGGEFRVGTDHPIYREWTVMQMAQRSDFIWLAKTPADWRTKPADWPDTRYEGKALEGEPVYLRYKRC